MSEGDELRIGEHIGRVIEVPGHTLGHIALIFDDPRIAFVGDTLFAMGCGRLFEGTAEQMYHSLQRLAALPEDTELYCGARIYAGQRPLRRSRRARQRRDRRPGSPKSRRCARRAKITLPTSVAQERETNPFVRATNVEEFARLQGGERQLPFMSGGA